MIDDIVSMTESWLNTESIYKDQAIELGAHCTPAVLNLDNIDDEYMVISKNTELDLRPLMGRIREPEECRKHGIPLKTGILLEGRYGL